MAITLSTATRWNRGSVRQFRAERIIFLVRTTREAEDNAIFYTFMVSFESLGVDAYQWLKETLQRIRPDMEEEQHVKLLPATTYTKAT